MSDLSDDRESEKSQQDQFSKDTNEKHSQNLLEIAQQSKEAPREEELDLNNMFGSEAVKRYSETTLALKADENDIIEEKVQEEEEEDS